MPPSETPFFGLGERDRPGRTAAGLASPILDHVLSETPRTAGDTHALPETLQPEANP